MSCHTGPPLCRVLLCCAMLCGVVLSGIGFCLFDFCSLDRMMMMMMMISHHAHMFVIFCYHVQLILAEELVLVCLLE